MSARATNATHTRSGPSSGEGPSGRRSGGQSDRPPTWDAVDQIVMDMQRVMPHGDMTSLQLVSRMLRVIRIFDRRREKILKGHGLEPWSFDMLAAIRRDPAEQMRPGDLLDFANVTSGTMTTRLDSLERRQLIERQRDSNDRRGVLVVLTPLGRDRIDHAFGDMIGCQQELIAGLGSADLKALERILRQLLRDNEGGSTGAG